MSSVGLFTGSACFFREGAMHWGKKEDVFHISLSCSCLSLVATRVGVLMANRCASVQEGAEICLKEA